MIHYFNKFVLTSLYLNSLVIALFVDIRWVLHLTFQVESHIKECWSLYADEGILWFETSNSCHGLDDGHCYTLQKYRCIGQLKKYQTNFIWRKHCYRIIWYSSDMFGCRSDLFQKAQSWKGSEGYRLTKRRKLTGQLLVPVGFWNPWLITY